MTDEQAVAELQAIADDLGPRTEGMAVGSAFTTALVVVTKTIAFIKANPQLVSDWYAIVAFVKDLIAEVTGGGSVV